MNKLIIVCEERLRKYGDFLAQLISLEDDKEDSLVGVKDGTVVAQVWTEKAYEDNTVQMSSGQHILFIGNSKLIKDKRSHMMKKYSEYGMQYGWLGKQGVLFIENIVDIENYDNFIEYAKGNQMDVKKVIEYKSDLVSLSEETNKNEENSFMSFLNPLKPLQAAIMNTPVHVINAINQMTNNEKIENQMYTCLVLEFYLHGLSQFFGVSEE